VEIRTYIEDLFKYLDTFESRYGEFDTEAFLQTYNGIYAVFQALRQQRDKAVEVDHYFLSKIKQSPMSSSDMRQLAIQILTTYFESEADIDGQSNKAYLYCRDLRPIKQDVTYFTDHLVPLLFREGSLNNNFRLNRFFLGEITRYTTKFGRKAHEDLSPEEFAGLSDPAKFLELMRRRQVLGEDIMSDRGSLEFHMRRIDAFTKLGGKSRLHKYYLTEWQYLSKPSRWARFKVWLGDVWGRFKGAFKSARYFRLVMTQRSAAYLWYGLIIVLFIFLAIYIPNKWQDYKEHRLQEFRDKATSQTGGMIR